MSTTNPSAIVVDIVTNQEKLLNINKDLQEILEMLKEGKRQSEALQQDLAKRMKEMKEIKK